MDEDVPLGTFLQDRSIPGSSQFGDNVEKIPRTRTTRPQIKRTIVSSESDANINSDDDENDDDDDEEEEEDKPIKRTRRTPASSPSTRSTRTATTVTSRRRKVKDEDSDANDEDQDRSGQVLVSVRASQRDFKMELMAQILARWWYVLPPWPPEDFDYSEALRNRKYREVDLDTWEEADDVDADGFTKVYQISNFPGVYRDPSGAAIDMRPTKNKPCYATLSSLSEFELADMAVTAYSNQLKALDKSPYIETEAAQHAKLRESLQEKLRTVERKRDQLKGRRR